jgi:phage repressor protein C with HTH and peptisase S24 domain
MIREAPATRSAKFSLLQLALPAKPPLNIGVLLLDLATDRLYKKLRRDWSSIADPENVEVLERLDEDFDARIAELGGEAFLRGLEDTLSNTLLITEREQVNVVSDFTTVLNRLFEEHVQRTEVIPFVTHVPLYSLRAAATKFGEDMEVEAEGWAPAPERLKLNRNMFAARVVGRSMEPLIPDGSLCLFRAGVVGSRQGKRLLIQRLGATDSSAEFTVKVYTSRKDDPNREGRMQNIRIALSPLNPEFEAMEFSPEDEHREFRVIAEFVQVLSELR